MSAARLGSVLVLLLVPAVARGQQPASITVTPGDDLAGQQLVAATSYEVAFAIANRGTAPDVFDLTCGGLGAVRCDHVAPGRVSVAPGDTVRVVVAFTTLRVGHGLLVLTAFSPTTVTRVPHAALLAVRAAHTDP